MSTRVNPFATLADPPVFTTKARTEKTIQSETLERIAEENSASDCRDVLGVS